MHSYFKTLVLVLSLFVQLGFAVEQSATLQAADSDMRAGKFADAVKKYKDANKQSGKDCFACLLGLSAALQHTGDFNAAVDSATKALRSAQTDGERAEAHNALGNSLLPVAQKESKRWKQVEAEFQAAMAADPSLTVAHMNLGIALLRQSRDAEGIQELQKFLAAEPNSPAAEQVKMVIADPGRARFRYAPDFEVTAEGGKPVSLKALSDKYVVLDFWATWCPPCRASVPELKDLTKRYSGRVVLLSMSADKDEKAWREFIAKKQMDWLQYRDSDQKMVKLFGVQAFPTYILIDRKGAIRQTIEGLDEHKTVINRLKDELEQMMKSEVH